MIQYFLRAYTNTGEKMIKLDHYPFTIGRYELADLCLEDESISSIHARIELRTINGKDHVVLSDNQSRNGIFCDGKKHLEIELKAGKDIYIGLIRVEVIPATVFSDQTREINISEYLDFKFNLKKYIYAYIPLSYLFYAGVKLLEAYLTSAISIEEWSEYLISNSKSLLGVIAISLVFSFISKINNKHYKFHQFLFLSNIGLSLVVLYSFIYPYLFQILWIKSLTPYVYFYGTYLIIFYFALVFARMIFERVPRLKIDLILSIVFFISLGMLTLMKNMKEEILTASYESHFAYPLFTWQQKMSYKSYKEFSDQLDEKFLKVNSKRKRH